MILNHEKTYWQEVQGTHTATEINQQPATWHKTIAIMQNQKQAIADFIVSVVSASDYDVIFTGAGTSEFVGNALAPLFLREQRPQFQSIATTNLVATPDLYINPKKPTLLVSFGRSGNSPESIAAIDIVNTINPNTKHLVITCNHEGQLALREEANLYAIKLPAETNDLSFAMTSSFSNMFIAAYLTFNLNQLDSLTDAVKRLATTVESILAHDSNILEKRVADFDFKRFVVLGDAELNGFAQESALKMLELSAGEVVTMFNTPLGFRHGPKSIINSEALTLVYLHRNEYTRKYQIDIIKEMSGQRQGNQIVVVDVLKDDSVRDLVDLYISIESAPEDDTLIGLAYVTIAQMLALYKSIALGKSPDNPWPSGMVNRVVQGVTIYPYSYNE